jgi:hypothetical protein
LQSVVWAATAAGVAFSQSDNGCTRRLSHKKKYDKRLAITVFSFPPDKGNVGTAAYLNVFGSIYKVLQASHASLSSSSLCLQCIFCCLHALYVF